MHLAVGRGSQPLGADERLCGGHHARRVYREEGGAGRWRPLRVDVLAIAVGALLRRQTVAPALGAALHLGAHAQEPHHAEESHVGRPPHGPRCSLIAGQPRERRPVCSGGVRSLAGFELGTTVRGICSGGHVLANKNVSHKIQLGRLN